MPTGRNVRDYYFEDWADGKRRWPVGWPCEVFLYPHPEARFDLEPVVELVHGAGQFSAYAGRLQSGPIDVTPDLGARLLQRLAPYPRSR